MHLSTKWILLIFLFINLVSCRTKKETTFIWKGPDESRTLMLLENNTFVLEVNGGYFLRKDTGTYMMKGDTLVLNPDRAGNKIDSLVEMDSLFSGQRFFEVMEEEIEFGMNNEVIGSFYRPQIFPQVILNDTLTLSVNPDDPGYRKLLIPDGFKVYRVKIQLHEDNTCKPLLELNLNIPQHDTPANSYRVFVRSRFSRENYLAGYKWLLRGDTVELFFKNSDCEPGDVKLVRAKRSGS